MTPACVEFDKVAPKLNGDKEGTFAYKTITDRWPKIVTKLIDYLKREKQTIVDAYRQESPPIHAVTLGEEDGDVKEGAEQDVRKAIAILSELKYLMMTDKPLKKLTDHAPDARYWNQMIEDIRDNNLNPNFDRLTWYKGDWLFVECYLYRFIYGAFYPSSLRTFDYFLINKQENFNDHIEQTDESCSYLLSIVAEDAPVHKSFGLHTIIKMSLWGNRADMSLTGGDSLVLGESAMTASAKRNEFLLVNDIDKMVVDILFPLLQKQSELTDRRIDIILDNAGAELIGDLLLAEYFISMGFADIIVLHGKAIPWFVSDVTKQDFMWTLNALKTAGEHCAKMAERLERRVNNNQFIFQAHPFWTYPNAYFEMERVSPDLYEDLKKSSLAFFKGDLNYRKLVGDRDWDFETTFKTACRDFAPCPFMALRTLKAETVAGLSKETVDNLIQAHDDDNSWMTSGNYAVCQLGGI